MGNGEDRRGRGRAKRYQKVVSVAVSFAMFEALSKLAEHNHNGSIGASVRRMLEDSLIMYHGRQLSAQRPHWL